MFGFVGELLFRHRDLAFVRSVEVRLLGRTSAEAGFYRSFCGQRPNIRGQPRVQPRKENRSGMRPWQTRPLTSEDEKRIAARLWPIQFLGIFSDAIGVAAGIKKTGREVKSRNQ